MRKLLLTSSVLVAAAAIGAALSGCETASCSDYKDPACIGAPVDGSPDQVVVGSDGGDGAIVDGAGDGNGGCDTKKSPKDEPCLVDVAYGVFVAARGSDTTGDGSKTNPYATIGKGIAEAKTKNRPRVYIANDTFAESVSMVAAQDGVSLFGGWKSADWTYETGKRPVVKPNAVGFALKLDGVTLPVLIEDIEFEAQNAAADGDSSIGAFVKDSPSVVLRRVTLTAGNGKSAVDGTLVPFTFPAATDLIGNRGTGFIGGPPKPYTNCPGGGSTTGGKGGNGGITPVDGEPGLPALGGGAKGTGGNACTMGGLGAIGTGGTDGAAGGNPTLGVVSSSGWTPSHGGNGSAGGPGQGGGGGGGDTAGGAGSGGAGGCGGAGGAGGKAGGSSIGLLLLNAPVRIENSEIIAKAAGNGGKGASGQSGMTQGGNGGQGDTLGGCQGGRGGGGGEGGAGGGGAGGVSVAVVHKGGAPNLSATTATPGTAGNRGLGGKPGVNDGVAGTSAAQLQIP